MAKSNNNISEDDLFGALGITSSSTKKDSSKAGKNRNRSSVVDDGLSIDALLFEDPINRRVSQTEAHIDSERSKARQMQLEASRDRTRAWREEVAKQKSHSSAFATASRNLNEQDEPLQPTTQPIDEPVAPKAEKSASQQILEVFGPKSVNVDYAQRRSNINDPSANAVAGNADQPIDEAGQRPEAVDQTPESQTSNLWAAKAVSRDIVQQRQVRDSEQLPARSQRAAQLQDAQPKQVRAQQAQQMQAQSQAAIAARAQSQPLSKEQTPAGATSQASTPKIQTQAAAQQVKKQPVEQAPRTSEKPAAKSDGAQRPSVKKVIDRQQPEARSTSRETLQDQRSDGRFLSLMDAESDSQTVYNSASLASQKKSAYDHDFLSDIRQRAPQPSEDAQVVRGRELSDEEIYEPRYEQPMVHSSIGPLGIALIIVAVLCVLIAVSMLTGLWDMSNITR